MPVSVTVAFPPEQIVVLEAIVTVGGGTTVIVTLPFAGALQLGVPDVAILTKVKVVVAVNVCVMVAVPATLSVIVWLPLPLL